MSIVAADSEADFKSEALFYTIRNKGGLFDRWKQSWPETSVDMLIQAPFIHLSLMCLHKWDCIIRLLLRLARKGWTSLLSPGAADSNRKVFSLQPKRLQLLASQQLSWSEGNLIWHAKMGVTLLSGICSTFFKKFIYLLIYYFWLHWVLSLRAGFSLVAASRGYSLLWCAGFTSRWLLLLWSTGSRAQAQ